MNYYLVECVNPLDRLRHYKNSRVAYFSRDQLNSAAGYAKYAVESDNDNVEIRLKPTNFEGVNPYK